MKQRMTGSPALIRWSAIAAIAFFIGAVVVLSACSKNSTPNSSSSAVAAPAGAASTGAGAANTGDTLMGAQLFSVTCAQCHGDKGQGSKFTVDKQTIEVPDLGWAGLNKMYSTVADRGSVQQQLEKAIMYGQDEEGDPLPDMMPRWRMTLSQAQVDSLIEYFKSGFQPTSATAPLPTGGDLYAFTCASCHGDHGEGSTFTVDKQTIHVPDLGWAGLNKMYSTVPSRGSVQQQLEKAIMDGQDEEGDPLPAMMPHWKTKLTQSQVDSLITYIQSGLQ